ncbi:MAG: hypothetical protein ACRD2W_11845 [Acidimicrobiales bacterium]
MVIDANQAIPSACCCSAGGASLSTTMASAIRRDRLTAMAKPTPVYLEVGSKKVFASALDWPGWCRSAKTEEEALETLATYVPR